ncbi:MAG: DUF4097 domain-containing protein [Clostridiales bacterium]|nr:DUF4097 domain-containing protein [Clostridiales bacterium]
MERNESFAASNLVDVAIHMGWAQVEVYADEIDRVQVLAAGDEASVNDLRIEQNEGVLLVEQPQYGISLNITESHWMQVCVRVPKAWTQKIHINTVGGMLNARGLNGSRIVLDTVSGDMRASRITAGEISLKTIIGDIRADNLTAESLSVRTVSGNVSLDDAAVSKARCTTVSGEPKIKLKGDFTLMDVRSVSGDVTLLTTVRRMSVSMRSISGRVSSDGVELTEDKTAPAVRVTGVSADLKLISAKA